MQFATTALDDQTYRHRVTADSCRVDVDIAEEVRHNGAWASLALPPAHRPSLSAQQRGEAAQRYLDSHPDPVPLAQFGRYLDAGKATKIMGAGLASMRQSLGFEGAPACFDALGDYLIDQRGVAFWFVTDLPGELNRFVLERADIDDVHSRLHLTKDDCRFVFTISAAVLAGDEWVARSVAPLPRAKPIP